MITPKRIVFAALLLIAGVLTAVAVSAVGDTTGTVTAAVPDRTITIPGVTNVQTYTIPTVTQTVTETVTTSTSPPPPPDPYPPTNYSVHHFWIGTFGTDNFNYSVSNRYDDFIAHAPDSWATQGAKFKAAQPNGRVLVYQEFGVAGDGVSTTVSLTNARANGWLAHHNGAEIPNPWNGNANTPVIDLGKPGVQAAYVSALQSKLAANPWDGVFADDVNDWQNLWANGQSIDGYTSPTDYWNRAVLPLLQYVHSQIAKPIIPNIGDWANQTMLDSAADALSGGNQEFFLMWGNAGSQAPSAIENEYASMKHVMAAGKPYYGIVHRTDSQGLKYAFCAAAIMGGDNPKLTRIANETAYGSIAPTWDPFLETNLGAPITAVSHTTGSVSWSRKFTNGMTLTIDTGAQICAVS